MPGGQDRNTIPTLSMVGKVWRFYLIVVVVISPDPLQVEHMSLSLSLSFFLAAFCCVVGCGGWSVIDWSLSL